MKRVLLIGFDPATVDFSDPALPLGMTAEKTHAAIKIALADFASRGWYSQVCSINLKLRSGAAHTKQCKSTETQQAQRAWLRHCRPDLQCKRIRVLARSPCPYIGSGRQAKRVEGLRIPGLGV